MKTKIGKFTGRKHSEETKKKIGLASAIRLQKIRDQNGGVIPWLQGKGGFPKGHTGFRTEESYVESGKKISATTIGRPQPHKRKEGNGMWKGDKASYHAKHIWLNGNYGKAKECENLTCVAENKRIFEYALLKGKKHKHDRKNYVTLCKSCHTKYDRFGYEILLAKTRIYQRL